VEEKMNVQVTMNDGLKITVDMENYNAQEIEEVLNNQSNTMVALGDIIVQRYSITRMVPEEQPAEVNTEIKMNDGTTVETFIEDYNAQTLMNLLNNSSENMIALGDVILQRFSITRIMPKTVQAEA